MNWSKTLRVAPSSSVYVKSGSSAMAAWKAGRPSGGTCRQQQGQGVGNGMGVGTGRGMRVGVGTGRGMGLGMGMGMKVAKAQCVW